MMSGPVRADARSERVAPSVLRAEIGAPRRRRRRFAAAEHDALGHGAALVHAGADHLDRDQLDRLLRPGAMAVGALVLGPERIVECGAAVAEVAPAKDPA
jgi:hypothetical protein